MINLFKVHNPGTLGPLVDKLFENGMVTEGEYSDRFEKEFSEYVGNENSSLVNSCTSALTLAFRLCDIQPDDEVIVTPMTCMATNEPASVFGAKLVWADIDPETGNIDPSDVKRKITPRTKAISAVHWAGQPFEIDEIHKIVKDFDIKVIEDAAHALGATYNGKPIGGHSDFTCFSFQAIKHLTTADGGAICSKAYNDDQRIKSLRWFGLDRKYTKKTGKSRWEQDVTEWGYKFHMNNLNALIGLEQMKTIRSLIKSHQDNSAFFDENINNSRVKKLRRSKNSESACWIYSLLVDDRDEFKSHMTSKGVATDVVHVRNDRYSVYKKFERDDLPGTDEFCSKMMNIPVGWWLTEEDRKTVVKAVNSF
tara:strand:+ start:14058 stop:15155 length:1098 start_codon:yes stop_codon:yes gene_type:complete